MENPINPYKSLQETPDTRGHWLQQGERCWRKMSSWLFLWRIGLHFLKCFHVAIAICFLYQQLAGSLMNQDSRHVKTSVFCGWLGMGMFGHAQDPSGIFEVKLMYPPMAAIMWTRATLQKGMVYTAPLIFSFKHNTPAFQGRWNKSDCQLNYSINYSTPPSKVGKDPMGITSLPASSYFGDL